MPVLLILVFIAPLVAGPTVRDVQVVKELNDDPQIVQENQFLEAADGAESTESITSFSETLDDDIMHYMDAFASNFTVLASSGTAGDDSSTGSYTDTQTVDETAYTGTGTGGNRGWVSLVFTLPYIQVETFNSLIVNTRAKRGAATCWIQAYNYDTPAWSGITPDYLLESGSYVWENGSGKTDSDFYDAANRQVTIRVWTADSSPPDMTVYVDYMEVIINVDYMTLADSDHYAESFADVSDIDPDSTADLGTDSDVMYVDIAGDSAYDYWYTNTPSFAANTSLYFEYQIKRNASANHAYFQITGCSLDDKAGTATAIESSWYVSSQTFVTRKGHIMFDHAIESIRFRARDGTAVRLYFDYFRLGPANEFGMQHDGSTTEGITNDGGAGITYTTSSNGEILILEAENTDGNYYVAAFNIAYDTTSTSSDIGTTYYPFHELNYNATLEGGATYVNWRPYVDGHYGSHGLTEDSAWHILRANVATYTSSSSNKFIWIYSVLDAIGEKFTLEINYTKFYSIADFSSFSQHADMDTNDYFYVVDGVLHCENDESNGDYMRMNYDPELDINYATYNIVNSTVFIDGSQDDLIGYNWIDDGGVLQDTWRTELTQDLTGSPYLKIDMPGSWEIHDLKFWEDATPPTISEKFANPPDPYDDESVMFTVLASDGWDLYTVTLNALEYPSGFNDVDYTMTETVDNTLYKYSFDTMLDGDYVFIITADDGANTAVSYYPITVRESEIDVDTVTLFGAGDDFTMMQWSFAINKDCTYVINEWSTNNPASDTHSGSVASGTRNIAWTKLTTVDSQVNFTVTFSNGSLSYVFESSYEVAQTALAINSYDFGFTQNEVTFNFDMTKDGTYTLYLNDVQEATDSFSTGSNFLNWTRTSSTDPAEVRAALKLSDGITTLWRNRTYDEYSLTAFSIESFIFSIGDDVVTAFVQTSFDNGTAYLYQDDVQKDTDSEGNYLSYSRSTTAGTYQVAFKVDCGGSNVFWYNDSYTVAITEIALSNPYYGENDNLWIFSATVNLNVNYYVYDNGSLRSSGAKTAGFFSLSSDFVNTIGKHIISIKFNTSSDDEWAGGSYDVTTTLYLDSIDIGQDNETVTVGFRVVRSATSSLTFTAYESGVVMATGAITINAGDFFSCSFDKSYVNIEGNATVVFTDGTSSVNVTVIYITVDQADYTTVNGGSETINKAPPPSLIIRNFQVFTTDDYAYAVGSTTLGCSYVAYQNGIEVSSDDLVEGSFNIELPFESGQVNVTFVFSSAGEPDIKTYAAYGVVNDISGDIMTISVGAVIVSLLLFLAMDRKFRAEVAKLQRQMK